MSIEFPKAVNKPGIIYGGVTPFRPAYNKRIATGVEVVRVQMGVSGAPTDEAIEEVEDIAQTELFGIEDTDPFKAE